MKEIAPYYAYNLQMWVKEINEIAPLYALENNVFKCIIEGEVYCSDDYTILPILRPLSMLTKEIEVNGELIMPIEVIGKELKKYTIFSNQIINILKGSDNEKKLNLIPYSIYQKLFELHFDVFGLIEKGLAINVNEINKEQV